MISEQLLLDHIKPNLVGLQHPVKAFLYSSSLEHLPSKSTTCMEYALTQRVKDICMTINVSQFFFAMKSEKGHSSLPDCYRFSLVKDKASLSLDNMAKLGALTGLYLEGIGASCYNDDAYYCEICLSPRASPPSLPSTF